MKFNTDLIILQHIILNESALKYLGQWIGN